MSLFDLPTELIFELMSVIDDSGIFTNLLCSNSIFLDVLMRKDISEIRDKLTIRIICADEMWSELPNGMIHGLYTSTIDDDIQNEMMCNLYGLSNVKSSSIWFNYGKNLNLHKKYFDIDENNIAYSDIVSEEVYDHINFRLGNYPC